MEHLISLFILVIRFGKNMIYTSQFKRLKEIPPDIVPISIAGWPPDGYLGIQFKVLAAKWEFFKVWKETHDNEYYIRCFNEQVLSKLDPFLIETRLYFLSGGKDVALLCYEDPGQFCHRHLVAEWFTKNDIPCFEIPDYLYLKVIEIPKLNVQFPGEEL